MSRMSKETQRELGMTDSQADFDEFLQEDEKSPRREHLKRKLKVRKMSKKAFESLKKATPRY